MSAITNRYVIDTIQIYNAVSAENNPEEIVSAFGRRTIVVWTKNGVDHPPQIPASEHIISNRIHPMMQLRRLLSGRAAAGPRHYIIKELTRQVIVTTDPLQIIDIYHFL